MQDVFKSRFNTRNNGGSNLVKFCQLVSFNTRHIIIFIT